MKVTLGLDFDNTLIAYDQLIHKIACDSGLISRTTPINKRVIRDQLWSLPEGDLHWQRIQSQIYGKRIHEATVASGLKEFIVWCRKENFKIYIISHKTAHAVQDPTLTNLREAALSWMDKSSFFEPSILDFNRSDVFFESTKEEKIARIISLECTHFVDDLIEIFQHPHFPNGVKKILYSPLRENITSDNIFTFQNWKEIGEFFANSRV